MRQNPVGEPAATAAWNFGTPRRRSSLKRLCPFCHCRQRYERNLRRIHASRLVSEVGETGGRVDELLSFTEGFDTPDLKEAKALLDELA